MTGFDSHQPTAILEQHNRDFRTFDMGKIAEREKIVAYLKSHCAKEKDPMSSGLLSALITNIECSEHWRK